MIGDRKPYIVVEMKENSHHPESLQDKVRRFMRKSPSGMSRSVLVNIFNFTQATIYQILFQVVSWSPRRLAPCFLAYYPDSLRSFTDSRDLYRRWIRGNRKNNNGDASRFMALMLNLRQLQNERIEGDFAELGVWKGNSAAILARFAAESGKKLFLFDTFSGFDSRDLVGIDEAAKFQFKNTSISYVQETVGHNEITTYVQGFFPESITPEVAECKFSLAHIDCDLYEPMKAALEFFYPRMSKGGMLILHDYSSGIWPGVTRAIDEFTNATGEHLSLWGDKSGTALIRKAHHHY
jgi:Macrocin-O-methyltransferase (TylF)